MGFILGVQGLSSGFYKLAGVFLLVAVIFGLVLSDNIPYVSAQGTAGHADGAADGSSGAGTSADGGGFTNDFGTVNINGQDYNVTQNDQTQGPSISPVSPGTDFGGGGSDDGGGDIYTSPILPCSITAEQAQLRAGQSTNLNWPRSQFEGTFRDGTFEGEVFYDFPGYHVVTPTETTTYDLYVHTYQGEREGGTDYYYECSVTVEVVPPPTCTITPADLHVAASGGDATVSWTIADAGDSTLHIISPSTGDNEEAYLGPNNGSHTVAINEPTVFRLDVWEGYPDGTWGNGSCETTIEPVPSPSCSININSGNLSGGGYVTAAWSIQNAGDSTLHVVSPGRGDEEFPYLGPSNGSQVVGVSENTDFHLDVWNAYGDTYRCSASVNVPQPRCDFLNASDRLLPYGGGQIDLNWGTTDASGAVISFSRCDNNGCVTSFTSNEDGSYNNQTVTETTLFTLQVGDVTAPVNKSVSQCIEIVNVTAPQCSDNQDNDGDGSTDTADLNCADCATRDVIEYSASQWYANPTWNSGGSVSSARADGYCVIQGHDGALSSTARNAAGENIRACWTSANSNNCAQCDESPWNGSGCNVIQTVQCYDETIVTQCLDDTEEADLNLRAENTSPSDGASYDEGEEIRLQGFMRNTGPDTLDVPVYAEILIDYYSDGLGILSQNAKGVNQYIIGLASGDVESLLVTLNNAPAGTHRYQIFVDSTNVITNEVETDNRTAWRSFTVVAPSIDLEAFNNAPAVNTSFDLGVNIPFTGSMRNNGPNAHTETINVHLEIDTTGNGSMNYDYRVTGNSITTNLNSGSSLPLEYGVNSLSPGIYHYRFNVDRAAIVAEDPNRANNTSPWIRFVVNAPDATGSISGTDCLIALNASTCDGTVSWNVTDPGSGTVRVYNTTTGQTVVSGVVTRNNHATTLQYGANVFQVQLDGSPLANTQLDASCTPGTVWLNSVCSTPPPTGIDLEGISVSPANNATFDEDEPITFTGTALSNGPDTVTDNFYADLEIDRNGDGIVASGDNHNAKSGGGLVTQNLVLGDSVPLSYTLSNLQPGVYRYRFNVDTDDRVQGEEDETNNVSAWRTFTISSLPVPTVELSVSLDGGAQDYSGPININDGQSAQVYWESENAVSCTVTQGASAGFVISPATLVDSFDDTITEPTPGNSVTFGVSCVNSAGVTASDTIVLSTNMPTGIDLEAQNNTPVANTSFVQGTNIVFTGTMLNNGPEAHTQDIYTDLEIDPPGSGSNYTYSVGGGIMTTNLANGESRGLTYGVDDLAPGTYYYRFVVDTEEYVIKDVDKINNLAPWIRFVVTPAPAPSAQLSISINGGVPDYSGPVTMDEGQYARVYWESENAVSCTVTQGAAAGFVISPSSNVNYNDSTITEPTSGNSVTFGVSCVNSAGVAATDTIVLSTNAVAVPSPSVALSVALNGGDRNYASSVTMDEGQAARIYWESSNASTCTVTQGAAAGFVISPATVTTYSDPTITEPTPGNSVTFGVSCVNSTGVAATDTLVLSTNVPAAFDLQAFSTAPANNGSFSTGESINFTGSFRSNGPGAVTPSFYADLEIDRNGDGIVASGDNHNAKSGGGYFTQNYNAGDTQTLGYSLYGLPAGSYRYRFNVDTNDQVPGESNETNNVSAWRSFTVTAAAVTVTLDAYARGTTGPYEPNLLSIPYISSISPALRWSSTGANVCVATAGTEHGFSTNRSYDYMTLEGEDEYISTPGVGQTYTFTVTCTNSGGGSGSDSVQVTKLPQVAGDAGDLTIRNITPTNGAAVNSGVYTSFQGEIGYSHPSGSHQSGSIRSRLEFDFNNDGVPDQTSDERTINQFFNGNGSSVAVVSDAVIMTTGRLSYRYRWVIDVRDDVLENNENNNTSSWTSFSVASIAGGYLNSSPRTCYIAEGNNSCAFSMNWLVNGAGDLKVRQNWRMGNFSNCTGYRNCGSGIGPASQLGKAGTYSGNAIYGRNNIRAHIDNSLIYHTYTDARCTPGLVWNGAVCESDPPSDPTATISVNVNLGTPDYSDTIAIDDGDTIWLYWESTSAVACTVTQGADEGFVIPSWQLRDGYDTSITAPTFGNSTTFAISCENSIGVTATDSVVVSNNDGPLSSPSGTLTGITCDIPGNASSCTGFLTWTTTDLGSDTPNVRNLTSPATISTGDPDETNFATSLAYGDNDFAVRAATAELATVRLTTACAADTTWSTTLLECEPDTPAIPDPSGTISGTGCIIADGDSTCTGSLTWEVINPTGNTNVYDGSSSVSTGDDDENDFPVTLDGEDTHTFRLRDSTTILDSVGLTAQCSATATWNGSICEVNTGGGGGGTPTIDADPSAIRDSDEVTITWDPALNPNCVMTSSANFPVGTIFTTPGSYTFNAPGNQSLSRTTEFVYKCDGVPAVTEKVFVLPTIFET